MIVSAVTERAMAETASRQNVASIHEERARRYQGLAHKYDLNPPPRMVGHHGGIPILD
jgi:hypothetical protein